MTDGQELVVVEQQAVPLTIFGTDEPTAIVERVTSIAQPLADFIKRQHMSTTIQGREYVLQEGWSFMGAMLGVAPRTVSVSELRDADGLLVGFEANIELVTRDGSVVGGAIAECSRTESHWRDRDDFALKSMSQTRACGKAYRMAFGFVMKAAGYEATPAEEMVIEGEVRREHPDGQRHREPRPPQPREAASGGFANVGALLTWARDTHGIERGGVLEILNVRAPSDISDLGEAQAQIETAMGLS